MGRSATVVARAARAFALAVVVAGAGLAMAQAPERLPIFDAHLHYSHDAWGVVPPAEAAAILRKAGLRGALVSSSDDDGTQKLVAAAPEIVIPELRPYRRRGDLSTWLRDPATIPYVEERLRKYRYVALGEFHVFGADAELPTMRRMVELAKRCNLILHAHSDADAVDRLFRLDPEARVLWAHSGFDRPAKVAEMLAKHPRLWTELAFRSEHAAGGTLDPDWRALMLAWPDRIMVGTDTFTPERWHYVVEHAEWSRRWLAQLPRDVAEKIGWRNAEALLRNGPHGWNARTAPCALAS